MISKALPLWVATLRSSLLMSGTVLLRNCTYIINTVYCQRASETHCFELLLLDTGLAS